MNSFWRMNFWSFIFLAVIIPLCVTVPTFWGVRDLGAPDSAAYDFAIATYVFTQSILMSLDRVYDALMSMTARVVVTTLEQKLDENRDPS